MKVQQLAARTEAVQAARPHAPPGKTAGTPKATQFADVLRRATETGTSRLQVSAHAEARIHERGIAFDALQKQSVSEAMNLLESRGSRDALLLRSDAAFVVNVPNRTVVTAIGREEMTDRVFTQIDSAMVL